MAKYGKIWELIGKVKATVRYKFKRGQYSCYNKQGKYKNYLINLDKLPKEVKNRYYGIKINLWSAKFYKESLVFKILIYYDNSSYYSFVKYIKQY